ncbi:uncharacterized protein HD556DRAFT_551641 [Suillus plorans]|uniref:Uncharacterized protein n=1 Tax=Suillus plorans TaxID=116603 RepID=A0A9P7DH92_9AGAM|nr:uncharacterized protein HD556DRAFT_551641 [Suillus plorans]KAG1792651.1 hypothetical protein HD556DRAFT_551641 [Suillus plorans]
MRPPKASTTIRISANFGPASQFANLPATFIQLKGRTDLEEGDLYLQLSLATLRELADLLEHDRLSETDKSTYSRAYTAGKLQYDQAVKLRDQLQTQKKSFRKFIVNLFVRKSDAERFLKVTYRAYTSIRRTSDDLARRLLPEKDNTLVFGTPEKSAQDQASDCEESPRDVVEDSLSVTDLPPNKTIRGLNVDVHNKQEEHELFATISRIVKARNADEYEQAEEAEEEEDDDGSATVIPLNSQSRAPSPSSSCSLINIYINQSVVSFDSESTGPTLNVGANEGDLSALALDINKPTSQLT